MPALFPPTTADDLATYIAKLESLSKQVSFIKYGKDTFQFKLGDDGKKEYGRYRRIPGQYERPGYKIWIPGMFYDTRRGYVYSLDESLRLQGKLSELLTLIQTIPKDPMQNEFEIKRVISATFEAICKPTEENFRVLQRVSNEVQGHGNYWKKIGLTLAGVTLTLVGIIPGLVYFGAMHRYGMWEPYKKKGLAAATESVVTALHNTEALTRMNYGAFFTTPRKEAAVSQASVGALVVAVGATAPPGTEGDPNPTTLQ
jgi:hypothetical protein